MDAFYLAFQGKLSEAARAALNAATARAVELRTDAPLEHVAGGGVVRGALSARSRDGWWLVSSAWLRVKVDEAAAMEWTVSVEATALLLMREGPRAALTMAREAALALLEHVTGERVRRLDLCADAVGVDLGDLDVEAFLQHRFLKVADISQRQQYWRAGMRTGFVWGKGDGVARLYDKTEHLRLGLDDTKADDERSEWRFAGWNGADTVARLECQLRGKMLDELELRDPEKCLERLDAVWSYFTKKWIRLVESDRWAEERRKPKEHRRKDRMPTDDRWAAFQDVVFRLRTEPAKRKRAPSTPHARRLVSAVINYCAASGALGAHVVDPHLATAGWSPAYAEVWVQEQLFSMSRPTIFAAKADLLSRFEDPLEAARHLMTKQAAAALKFTRRCEEKVASVAA